MKFPCAAGLILALTTIVSVKPSFAQNMGNITVAGLRTEYLENPIGIDAPKPRFTWTIEGYGSAFIPKGARIIVSEDSVGNSTGTNSVWQKQLDGHQQRAVYEGKPLLPFTRYYWRVYVTDSKDRVIASPVGHFETGMISTQHWKGAWISDG